MIKRLETDYLAIRERKLQRGENGKKGQSFDSGHLSCRNKTAVKRRNLKWKLDDSLKAGKIADSNEITLIVLRT